MWIRSLRVSTALAVSIFSSPDSCGISPAPAPSTGQGAERSARFPDTRPSSDTSSRRPAATSLGFDRALDGNLEPDLRNGKDDLGLERLPLRDAPRLDRVPHRLLDFPLGRHAHLLQELPN